MRWLYLTIALLASSACLVGWIYLRDRDTNWQPSEAQLAHADAAKILSSLRDPDCHPRCAAKLLGSTQPHLWLLSVTMGGRTRCLQIDVATFRVAPGGLLEVPLSRCTVHPAGRAKA
jgi:hypothetical protein